MAKPKKPKLTVKSNVSRLPSDNTSNYTSEHKYVTERPIEPMSMLDPTGISNYPELMNAVQEGRYKDVPLELLGSLPMVGKAGKAINMFKTKRGIPLGKFLPLVDDINEAVEYKNGGYIPKYMDGSTVGSIVGAGVGALGFLAGPPVGMATMGLGSNLGAKIGGEFDSNEPVENPTRNYAPTMFNMDRGTNNNFYPFGGMTGPNAEVELQEVAKTPQGQTIMFDGPSHAEGGIKTALPPGTEITSDRLINPMTGNTFAKDQANIERKKARMSKKLVDRPNDKFVKNGIKLLDAESDKIFQLQESMKGPQMPQQMFADGGTFKFPFTNEWNDLRSTPYGSDYMDNPNIPRGSQGLGVTMQADYNNQVNADAAMNTPNVDYGNIGLGLGAANTLLQVGQSFFPDKINRISNPNAQRGMNTYSDAIRRQRGLRYNINDQLTDINNSELAGNRYINNNVSAGNVRAGNMLANRALSMNARNQLYGDRNRMETGFQSEANKMQMGYADYMNQLGMQQAGFDQNYRDTNLQQRANLRNIRSQGLGNMSNVLQGYARDQQMMRMLPYMFPNANPNMWR